MMYSLCCWTEIRHKSLKPYCGACGKQRPTAISKKMMDTLSNLPDGELALRNGTTMSCSIDCLKSIQAETEGETLTKEQWDELSDIYYRLVRLKQWVELDKQWK